MSCSFWLVCCDTSPCKSMNPRLNLNWSRRRVRGGFMLNRLSKDYQICNSNLLCLIYSCHFFPCLDSRSALSEPYHRENLTNYSDFRWFPIDPKFVNYPLLFSYFFFGPANKFWTLFILLFSSCKDYEKVSSKIKTLITIKTLY